MDTYIAAIDAMIERYKKKIADLELVRQLTPEIGIKVLGVMVRDDREIADKPARQEGLSNRCLRFVEENPGCSTASVKAATGGKLNSVSACLFTMVNQGRLVRIGPPRKPSWYLKGAEPKTEESPIEVPKEMAS